MSEIREGQKLNILMITHHRFSKAFIRPGALGEYLARQGHDVTMIVTADTNRWHWKEHRVNGVRVLESPDLLWGRLRTGWDLWASIVRTGYLLREMSKFDVVHLYETRPSTIIPFQFAKQKRDVPLIIDWNDWWAGPGGIIDQLRPRWYRHTFGRLEAFFETYYRKHADGTTVISAALQQRATGMGIAPDSILRLPGGTRPEEWSPKSIETCRSLVPRRFGNSLGSVVVGFASLDSHIDLDIVFGAMAILRRHIPDACLLITGRVSPDVAQMASRHGVTDALRTTGWVADEELPAYLGCSNVCVLPLYDATYNRGRWPNKITDYANIGRPIVTNDVGDMGPLVRDNNIGLLTEFNAEAFAAAILSIIENPKLAEELGANARKLAEGDLALFRRASALEDFYIRTINSKATLSS